MSNSFLRTYNTETNSPTSGIHSSNSMNSSSIISEHSVDDSISSETPNIYDNLECAGVSKFRDEKDESSSVKPSVDTDATKERFSTEERCIEKYKSDDITPVSKVSTGVMSVDSSELENHKANYVATDNLVNLTLNCGSSNSFGSRKVCPEDFTMLKVIGKGSYGKVMMVRYNYDNKIYAMKILKKESIIKLNQVEHIKTERNVLKSINHPFIVQLYFAFQTTKKLYFVLEYCPGGELFFHLSRAVRFHESVAIFYAAEIVLSLEHLHKLNIVYRDLKPENVLLDQEGHIRLTDFGLSKEGIQDNFSARSLCGTPEYLAPEILNQTGHGKAVDWWSLGALIYEMLTGLPPFYTKDRERLFENIRSGKLCYSSFVSCEAKSLLTGLFQRDPSCRLGGGKKDALEIKSHPFFASVDWQRLLHKKESPPFRPCLHSITDVQYFDNELLRLSAKNSEVTEPTLPQGLRDEIFQGFSYDGSDDLQ